MSSSSAFSSTLTLHLDAPPKDAPYTEPASTPSYPFSAPPSPTPTTAALPDQVCEKVPNDQSPPPSFTHFPSYALCRRRAPALPLALFPGKGTPHDPFVVDFPPNDHDNPQNWTSSFRWIVTLIIALDCLCIAFSSSSYSASLSDLHKEFPGTSSLEGIAGISLYVLGFGIGPLIWAPLSELMGRYPAFVLSYPLFAIFNMAAALTPNVPALLVFRFLAGTFGAAPLTNAGGQIGDMWKPHERALAGSLFALAPFLGPVLGPIVGGFVTEAKGFRWVFWVNFIFAVVTLTLHLLFVPETYAPTLLRRRARQHTAQSLADGTNLVFVSKFDTKPRSRMHVIKVGMTRPLAMTVREVIVLCLGIYAAIIYGTLYLFFTAYPIVFQQNRGWSISHSGLAFLGIGIGLVLGLLVNPLGDRFYDRAVAKANRLGLSVPPESRLPMCCVGAILLPLGLFIFAWTCTPNVHWIVPILASVPFGCGYLLIFTGIQMYLIDAYPLYAASALASNAVLRSIFGTVFPLFSVQLYHVLGLNWAGTFLAFLSLACTPMPFLFYRYGPALRAKSKYAPPPGKPISEAAKESLDGVAIAIAAGGLMVTGEPDRAIADSVSTNQASERSVV